MIECKRIKKLPRQKIKWVVMRSQKRGKHNDSAKVCAALQGADLYIKDTEAILGGLFVMPNATDYPACEVCQRIDEGIGVSVDAARLMRDAVMELWKRLGLSLGVRKMTRSPKTKAAPDIYVVSKTIEPCDNIQCPKAETCRRYLPWEPCELPYEVGGEANCEYYIPTRQIPAKGTQLTIDF